MSKIPPKLLPDQPSYRPNNKNYVEYINKLHKYKKKGRNIGQSLAIISYANTERNESHNTDNLRDSNGGMDQLDIFNPSKCTNLLKIPRYLPASSNTKKDNAFSIKKRMLMSKYIHK
jgi:hypothetical protein